MARFCKKCGTMIDADSAFCEGCGTKVVRELNGAPVATATSQEPTTSIREVPAATPAQPAAPVYQQPVQHVPPPVMAQTAPAASGSSSGTLVAIIVVVMVLVAGLGAGGYYWYGKYKAKAAIAALGGVPAVSAGQQAVPGVDLSGLSAGTTSTPSVGVSSSVSGSELQWLKNEVVRTFGVRQETVLSGVAGPEEIIRAGSDFDRAVRDLGRGLYAYHGGDLGRAQDEMRSFLGSAEYQGMTLGIDPDLVSTAVSSVGP